MHDHAKGSSDPARFSLLKLGLLFLALTGFSSPVTLPLGALNFSRAQPDAIISAIRPPERRVSPLKKASWSSLERRLQSEWAVSTSC